jgi:hypothetical protein
MRTVNIQHGGSKQNDKSRNNENKQKQRHWTKINAGTQLAKVEQSDPN